MKRFITIAAILLFASVSWAQDIQLARMSPAIVGGGVAAAGWTPPADVDGVLAWYSASDISGLSDNDPVQTWEDLSGNEKHLTQATEASRPLYKTGVRNEKAALLFDRSDDYMFTGSNISGIKTIIAVGCYTRGGFPGSFIDVDGLVTSKDTTVGENYPWMIGSDYSLNNGQIANQKMYIDDEEKTGPFVQMFVNDAWHIAMVTNETAAAAAVQVGWDRQIGTRLWLGYIAEVILLDNVLSTGSDVINYLKTKYNIP